MSDFNRIDDLSYRTEAPTSVEDHDSLDAWVNGSADTVLVMDSDGTVMIRTRAGAIALRDWLTAVIGDAK